MLALDEHAVVDRDALARATRQANADHANLVRSSRAAHAGGPCRFGRSSPRDRDGFQPELQEIAGPAD